MPDAIIYIDPDQPMNLQNQIRQRLVDGILNGSFAPGMKLPSSRKLAQQLDVARNTVVAAYQQLIADGYLVSRQRSGIFVNEEMLEARVGQGFDLPPRLVPLASLDILRCLASAELLKNAGLYVQSWLIAEIRTLAI